MSVKVEALWESLFADYLQCRYRLLNVSKSIKRKAAIARYVGLSHIVSSKEGCKRPEVHGRGPAYSKTLRGSL